MGISANWEFWWRFTMAYDAAITPNQSVDKVTGGVWKKNWRRWAFYGLQRPLESRFFRQNKDFLGLPEALTYFRLIPKSFNQILVRDFEPLFKVNKWVTRVRVPSPGHYLRPASN